MIVHRKLANLGAWLKPVGIGAGVGTLAALAHNAYKLHKQPEKFRGGQPEVHPDVLRAYAAKTQMDQGMIPTVLSHKYLSSVIRTPDGGYTVRTPMWHMKKTGSALGDTVRRITDKAWARGTQLGLGLIGAGAGIKAVDTLFRNKLEDKKNRYWDSVPQAYRKVLLENTMADDIASRGGDYARVTTGFDLAPRGFDAQGYQRLWNRYVQPGLQPGVPVVRQPSGAQGA